MAHLHMLFSVVPVRRRSACPIACAISAVGPCIDAAETSTLSPRTRPGGAKLWAVMIATSLVLRRGG